MPHQLKGRFEKGLLHPGHSLGTGERELAGEAAIKQVPDEHAEQQPRQSAEQQTENSGYGFSEYHHEVTAANGHNGPGGRTPGVAPQGSRIMPSEGRV